MQILALIETIAAQVTPANIQLYITLLDNIITAAEKIEDAISESKTPPQNGSAS